MSDTQRGVFQKFHVTRADGGGARGRKHFGCEYFVLDLNHDPHALPALRAYAESCAPDYPALAEDLRSIVAKWTLPRSGPSSSTQEAQ